MKHNKVLDIIINLLIGVKSNKCLVDEFENGEKFGIGGCSYILNQTLRQYHLPEDHYFISEKADELWMRISEENILKYSGRKRVKKTIEGDVYIDLYKGSEKNPHQQNFLIKHGDCFVFNDVFTDEHIVPISDIIKELLTLPNCDYDSVKKVLDKMYICKILKQEDRRIVRKSGRPTNYKEIINTDYLKADIKIKNFKYED